MFKRLIPLLLPLSTLVPAVDFKAESGTFILDGKTYQVRSGEIHYPRVPRAEWANRIRMAKAMGLNTISTYVFWNLHETKPGEFDFNGDKDVTEFVRTCAAEGMKVIVRPGPYVCAEWDLGGLPAWLLAEPGIKLRSTDPRYLTPAKAWMKRMGELLQPLSVAQGGPVLMVQLENEFGNFGKDPEYLAELEKALRAGGYQGIIFTGDGPAPRVQRNGGLPGMLKAVNFGRDAEGSFRNLKSVSPDQPAFNAEFWVGWFDQWESPHHFGDSRQKMDDFRHIMKTGASFNIYMFHGGSTRGLWTGANWAKTYRPTTCCYDYGAPLDESGRPTSMFHSFRSLIQRAEGDKKLPELPVQAATGSIGPITLTERWPLLDSLPKGETHRDLKNMEQVGQTTGMILYRTTVTGPLEGSLELGHVKDRVHVMLDGVVIGISGRSTRAGAISVRIPEGAHRLDLLVENMGRINYGLHIMEERKGLSGSLLLGDKELGPFEHISLPMQTHPTEGFTKMEDEAKLGESGEGAEGVWRGKSSKANYYRSRIQVLQPVDTWLDIRGFGRGVLWFNGHNLGRYWKAGPPQTVSVPACWMKTGEDNELVMLELEADTIPKQIPSVSRQIWGSWSP